MIKRILEKLKQKKEKKVVVNIVVDNCDYFPQRQTDGAAGYDLRASITEPLVLKSFIPMLVGTGIKVEIPHGYHGKICIRSSMGKKGLIIPNAPGIIDSDYRDEIKVILMNISSNEITIQPKERIAQFLLEKNNEVDWSVVNILSVTKRNLGGFGSTGAL
jgi:dUTP pyrophosphatase